MGAANAARRAKRPQNRFISAAGSGAKRPQNRFISKLF